jgi:hypothetical protein
VRHKIKKCFLTKDSTWTKEGDVFVSKDDLETAIQMVKIPVMKALPLCEIVEYDLLESKRYSVFSFIGDNARKIVGVFFSARDIVRGIKE